MNPIRTTDHRDHRVTNALLGGSLALVGALTMLTPRAVEATEPGSSPASVTKPLRLTTEQARGEYLMSTAACMDCHTPWKLGDKGPEPDTTRLYSGHPEQLKMPPAPSLPEGPWVMTAGVTNTAWAGPWGVSFTANLTPDIETGLGRWSEADFIRTIRTGRHMGRGRAVLPPMPIAVYNHFTDRDLKAIYAYLRTIPPIRNKVPDPVPPAPQAAR
ncbi:MAG TPA: diheme cytochrome c-553 [Caldimonas sp.]|nr:diheme cytochrome c-553 [Caldimonas sp.]